LKPWHAAPATLTTFQYFLGLQHAQSAAGVGAHWQPCAIGGNPHLPVAFFMPSAHFQRCARFNNPTFRDTHESETQTAINQEAKKPDRIGSADFRNPIDCLRLDEKGEITMNELINTLIQKTGLPEDKASVAVDTVVNYLKSKLPTPIASQLDSVVSGEGGGLSERLGSVLGKKSA
jgi:hypothetical protein